MVVATSDKPFGQALRDLLMEHDITTPIGNPDWSGFAGRIGVNYESLRKAVSGERQPPRPLLEACADRLEVEPSYFAEYRLMLARDALNPVTVGFDSAMIALRHFTATSAGLIA